MWMETRFCPRRFGSHGQQLLLTVGFSPRCTKLPTTTANCAVVVATDTVRDIKGEALG